MSLRESRHTVPLLLKAVKRDRDTSEERQVHIYLHFHLQDGKLRPIKLGTGRSAVVLLATEFGGLQAGRYQYAVKFLREDPDPQYSEASAQRFFTEARQMQLWGRGGGYLVNYVGWGAIAKNLDRKDTRGDVKEFWWNEHGHFWEYDPAHMTLEQRASGTRPILDNNSDVFEMLKQTLKLQGPFYVMDLCQGTLEDLLEGSESWSQLAVYQWIDRYKQGLETTQGGVKKDIEWFYDRYLDLGKPKTSGYDILNSFHIKPKSQSETGKGEVDPNRIRNYAVLQLFRQIAGAVDNLHRGTGPGLDPLAHRDIKPGNIFLQHRFDNPTDISILLADLGYVSALNDLGQFLGSQSPDVVDADRASPEERNDLRQSSGSPRYQSMHNTGVYNRRGAAYQAPGSQFYRAPEQAELPIEVRVTVDPARRNVVIVKGAKLSGIEPNDWLLIDDLQDDRPEDVFRINEQGQIEAVEKQPADTAVVQFPGDPHVVTSGQTDINVSGHPVFTILEVRQDEHNIDLYELILDKEVNGDELHNLHAQITKATGFHTDGYSLGAILYDLASGGKNPEHFFTYCLRVFTTEFTRRKVEADYSSVDLITDVLCPSQDTGKSTDSVFGRSFRQTKEYNFKRPRPDDTKGPMPNGSVAKLFATGMGHKGADHYLDQAVGLIYPPKTSESQLTWGDLWRRAREASAGDADRILNELAELLYSSQPVQSEATWGRIWNIVRAARAVSSPDEFLDHVVRILYTGTDGLTPEKDSIWQVVTRAQGGINADEFLHGVVELIYLDRPEDRDRRIRNLQFRKFHVVEDLLKDKRGQVIHREIIRLIVSCMMRGIEGSYYQLDPQYGYNSPKNTQAVKEVRAKVDELLQTRDFDLEVGSVPASLRENILFGLRCLSDNALRIVQPPAPPPQAVAPAPVASEAPRNALNSEADAQHLPATPLPADEPVAQEASPLAATLATVDHVAETPPQEAQPAPKASSNPDTSGHETQDMLPGDDTGREHQAGT